MAFAGGMGAKLFCEEQGDQDGQPVILIPGIGLTTTSWSDVTRRLTAEGFRVILMDPRGSGRSDKPRGPYSGDTMAADVVAVLDHVGVGRAHVVGLSMGGMIAQEVAIRYPERVAKLILTSTYARVDAWSKRVLELRRAVITNLGFQTGFQFSSLFVFSPQAFRERRDFIAQREAEQAQVDGPSFLAQLDFLLAHDTESHLKAIRARTLVICGELDMLTSALQNQELAAGIADATLEIVRGASHGMVWDRTDEYADRILSFLRQPVAAGALA
jgi:pimeloyl-ACP methyl ester carboxylesterase